MFELVLGDALGNAALLIVGDPKFGHPEKLDILNPPLTVGDVKDCVVLASPPGLFISNPAADLTRDKPAGTLGVLACDITTLLGDDKAIPPGVPLPTVISSIKFNAAGK